MQNAPARPVISLCNVTRRYGALLAVDDASFTVERGETACLLGPSGSGKSTILRMLSGLEPVDSGEIHIDGQCISSPGYTKPPETRGVGLVFQDNALFPHLDVVANIGFGLQELGAAQRALRVATLLEQFHIQHLAKSWPHMLSGGEQQRVAIARALAREPSLLLLDEPFSGLDGVLRESVRDAVLQDLRRAGATVLIVTHDPLEAIAISDTLVLMAGGKILQTGTPHHCYHAPQSITAARLLGELMLFDGHVRDGQLTTFLGTQDALGMANGPAQLGIRPEALRLQDDGAPATMIDIRFAGASYRLTIEVQGQRIALNSTAKDYAPGQSVMLGYDHADARIFR